MNGQRNEARSLPRVDLYTIGYEGRTAAQFSRVLADAGIVRLIDVRLSPRSRVKGFSLIALFERLRKLGITYEHRAGLGNPLAIRALFHEGRITEGRRRFRARMTNGHKREIDTLVKLAQVERTAIMCREADVDACHRRVLADLVEERGLTVVHL